MIKHIYRCIDILLKELRKHIFRFIVHFLSFGSTSKYPQRNLALGYIIYIIIGFTLLSLPFSQLSPISLIDNLFIVTSAVSTTGLGTVDIGTSYTFFGQLVILILIQLGGIGYMTFSSYLMYNMTKHFILIKKDTVNTSFSIPSELKLSSILRNAINFTFLFEFLGALVLFILFKQAGISHCLWNAIFHSISAFCTAGFSLFNDSLVQFDTNFGVNIVISILSYAGAMGFIVMTDIWQKINNFKRKLIFTTKVILFITTIISILGTSIIYLNLDSLKYDNAFDRVMIAFFQTMSAMTTVGFNSTVIDTLPFFSLYIIMIAMFVGASPSGTGGGVKTTTISAVYAFIKSKLSQERNVLIGNNRIPTFRLDTALCNFIFYQIIILIGFTAMIITENIPIRSIIFEVVSALGTVGLSTGITSSLTVYGKIIIIILMYIGRLGVITFGGVMLLRMKNKVNKGTTSDLAI